MHANSVLNSNLLDIIFENRNKEYGAYVLRKNYNKRLLKSLIAVFVLIILFILWQLLVKPDVTAALHITTFVPDPAISPARPIERKIEIKNTPVQAKPSKNINSRPAIVKDEPDIPAHAIALVSPATAGDNTEDPPFEAANTGANVIRDEGNKEIKPAVPAIVNEFINSPEVLPEFPGGIEGLMKFLKTNLHAPRDMEDGENIGVKVKFIVNYTGDLTGFTIIKTGGEAFDEEVIRVLKKMPHWIPGRNGGKNVSTYFVIPIKFVSD